ncbi:MAG: thioredoxin family protein [bacterium]
MTDRKKKFSAPVFPLFLIASLFPFFSGCSGAHQHLIVKKGDLARVNYTCRVPDGDVVATTSKRIAEDNTSYPKSPVFTHRQVYGPSVLTGGQEIVTSEDGFLKEFEKTIEARLSQLIVGTEVGKEYSFEIDANTPANLKDEDRFLQMARVRKRPKEKRMPRDYYLKLSKGLEPEAGQRVEVEPGLWGKVISLDGKDVLVKILAQPGSRIPTPPFGQGLVSEKEDYYEIEIEARVGDLIKAGPYTGRVVEVNDQVIISDFAHPFGGEMLTCEVKVEAVDPPGASGRALQALQQAVDKARQSETGNADIHLNQSGLPEDPNRVQPGDLILADYTISLEDGQVYRTSRESVAHDPNRVKMPEYQEPRQFLPLEIIAGEPSDIPGLSEASVGLPVHGKKTITIPADKAFGPPGSQEIKKFPLNKRLPRTMNLSPEQYVQKFKMFPSLDARVPLTPYFEAVVTEVTPQYARLSAVIEDGKQYEDPFGTTGVFLDGNQVVISLQPRIGATFEMEGKKGIITEADEDNFTVDFRHPLAGRNIVLDFEVTSLTKASKLKKEELPWQENHDQGLDTAGRENKPIVLFLYADWCPWCQKMLQETYRHPLMKTLADKFVWLKINSEKESKYKALYQQDGFPLTVLLDSQGKMVKKFDGFIPATALRRELDNCLEGY